MNNVEARKIELEVTTSIQTNHLNIDLSYTNKEVKTSHAFLKKFQEEEKLEKELKKFKEKVMEEYISS